VSEWDARSVRMTWPTRVNPAIPGGREEPRARSSVEPERPIRRLTIVRPAACVAVGLGLVGLVGCGSSAPATTHPPTVARPPAATTTLPAPPPTVATVTTTPPPSPAPPPATTLVPRPPVVTITNATLADTARRGVSIRVGAVMDIELTSDAYNRSGALVPWPVTLVPPVGATPVLVAAPAPATCPSAASCHAFEGAAPGQAVIVVSGPSGIVCDKAGTHCIGVAAAIFHLAVTVTT